MYLFNGDCPSHSLILKVIRLWFADLKLRLNTSEHLKGPACMCGKSLQSYLTLCDTMDCSLPGSFVHGILQEWVAIPFSRGSSQPRDRTHASSDSFFAVRLFTAEPPQKALKGHTYYNFELAYLKVLRSRTC